MENRIIAVLDACVLYPAPLRDLLLSLAVNGLFSPRWSAQIHDEWISAVLRQNADNPNVTPQRLQRTRKLMDACASGALVDGYEALADGIDLPDKDDCHVVAAASHCGAGLIVTFNLKHFPSRALKKHHLAAVHPDAFVARLLVSEPTACAAAAREHRARLQNPPYSVRDYLLSLENQRLVKSAALLQTLAEFL